MSECFLFSHSNRCVVEAYLGLYFYVSNTSTCWTYFQSLFLISCSPLDNMFILIFYPLLWFVICFLIVAFKSALYIIPTQICDLQMFSQSVACPFYCISSAFPWTKGFNFVKFNLSFLMDHVSGAMYKSYKKFYFIILWRIKINSNVRKILIKV